MPQGGVIRHGPAMSGREGYRSNSVSCFGPPVRLWVALALWVPTLRDSKIPCLPQFYPSPLFLTRQAFSPDFSALCTLLPQFNPRGKTGLLLLVLAQSHRIWEGIRVNNECTQTNECIAQSARHQNSINSCYTTENEQESQTTASTICSLIRDTHQILQFRVLDPF